MSEIEEKEEEEEKEEKEKYIVQAILKLLVK